MSHQAIAAALARADLSVGERLVAFSLASFADRDSLARPGTMVAAGRAGLGKSRFLEAQEGLMRRGLVVVVQRATGRGRASLLALPLAEAGPWWEGDVNAGLFEAVLGYSRARGSARLLLAAMAALADESGVVEGITTEELCAAAGITERTYGRVRGPLLVAGELVLRAAARGRGNTNCWEISDPRAGSMLSGVSRRKGGHVRTLSCENPAESPAENPARNARAGREPQNPGTHPPSPPEGGSGADQLMVEEEFVSERGRRRRRLVPVDLDAVRARLTELRPADQAAWEHIRALLLEAVGESTFEIWLAQLELLAVDRDGRLVVGTPEATRGWVCARFGGLLERCADRAGRGIRFADGREQAAVQRSAAAPPSLAAAGEAHGGALSAAAAGLACQSSYTHVCKQQKEVS